MSTQELQRILVIDDDESFRRDICVELEFHGYAVEESVCGHSGVLRARSSFPDAVVCDDRLPSGSGVEVMAALKADPLFATVPFVLLMNFYDGNRASIALEAGAADVIARPFKMADLVARVRRSLRPPPRMTGSVFRGQLTFFSLPDVLIMTAQNMRTGSLQVRDDKRVFRFIFREGKVIGVRGPRTSGLKAFFRALRIADGEFKFTPWSGFVARPWHDPINVNAVLLTGTQEIDELPMVVRDFPKTPVFLTAKAKRRGIAENDVAYPLLEGPRTIDDLLDSCPEPDLEVANAIKKMISAGELDTIP